jgi:hypothetical protein
MIYSNYIIPKFYLQQFNLSTMKRITLLAISLSLHSQTMLMLKQTTLNRLQTPMQVLNLLR